MDTQIEYGYREALVGEIVRSYVNQCEKKYPGRIVIQKVCYFTQVLGVPLGLDFQIHRYGPFSERLWWLLDDFVINDVVLDRSNSPEYSLYDIRSRLNVVIDAHREIIDKYKSTIGDIVGIFKKFSPQELELIATVHYVARALKTKLRRAPKKDELTARFKQFKGERFDSSQIERVFDVLSDARLIA